MSADGINETEASGTSRLYLHKQEDSQKNLLHHIHDGSSRSLLLLLLLLYLYLLLLVYVMNEQKSESKAFSVTI